LEQPRSVSYDSRCSACVAGSSPPFSRHPRVARAGTPVVPHDDLWTAVRAFIRMGHAVRAGQFDADPASVVQGRIDCAGHIPALAGLARTPSIRAFSVVEAAAVGRHATGVTVEND